MCANGYGFTFDHKNEEKVVSWKERRKCILKIEEFLEYAIKKYGCVFPENFSTILYDSSYAGWVPNEKIMDAIVAEWLIWEPYVSQDSFQRFVNHEISTFFKAHCTSTFGVDTLEQYIGVKATVVNEIPFRMSTTIDKKGTVRKNVGKM